jgi:hypothetical protein
MRDTTTIALLQQYNKTLNMSSKLGGDILDKRENKALNLNCDIKKPSAFRPRAFLKENIGTGQVCRLFGWVMNYPVWARNFTA